MAARFVPVMPPRLDRPRSAWSGVFGKSARNTIGGWSERAFEAPYLRGRLLTITLHTISDPDAVQHVLLDNAANYVKPAVVKRLLAPLSGRGLLGADGDLWRKQRRMVAPTFAPAAIASMAPLIARVAERQVAGWPKGPALLDMAAEATRATMAIIVEALFSADPRLMTREASDHIAAALNAAAEARLGALLRLPVAELTRTGRRGRRGVVFLRRTLDRIVRERGIGGGADDFLGGLIRALAQQFPEAEALELAVDNAATFYLAGHETTANALAWTLYLLSEDREAQERARAESIAALSADPAELADKLPWTRQVLEEALRLYPSAPRFDREALGEDVLCGAPIRRGEIVTVMPWLVHRHHALWDAPDAFDPERFAPEAKARLHRFQYIPFGAGPRVCIGARFATMEALIILAHWLAARRFAPSGRPVVPAASVTLRPEGGLWLQTSPSR
ncbi:putative cytochrome P450 [Sphingomonas changbaiensis NBRC 104936]|uniref:Putative cytochrome P450 n=1 Tax=Sphingomonas changbaiensis NBRC 104936 TaxID=1219043 RepID=A0A0E9MRY4_9SPHN|nr:cytochrome P450 [Sphingomonas changbaiensis]GAO39875.1 putative cytochrome P450 [Sphingomonas changbaiensis NBRC 104936]